MHSKANFPASAKAVIEALADQFTLGGTDGLENQLIWQTPDVSKAGGLKAIAAVGEPRKLLQEIKERMFAA